MYASMNQGVKYNIPVSVWLPEGYPRYPPIMYVLPTPDMVIKPQHSFVDASGVVSSPYVRNWIYPRCRLGVAEQPCSPCVHQAGITGKQMLLSAAVQLSEPVSSLHASVWCPLTCAAIGAELLLAGKTFVWCCWHWLAGTALTCCVAETLLLLLQVQPGGHGAGHLHPVWAGPPAVLQAPELGSSGHAHPLALPYVLCPGGRYLPGAQPHPWVSACCTPAVLMR